MYLVDCRGRNGAAKVLNAMTNGGYDEYNKTCFHAEVELLKKMRDADHIVQLFGHCDPGVSIVPVVQYDNSFSPRARGASPG